MTDRRYDLGRPRDRMRGERAALYAIAVLALLGAMALFGWLP